MERQNDNGLSGLDPAELLKQGAGEDTFTENHPGGFTPPTLEELSEIFPRFEILELIGKGGMGAVYKVRQPELDRIVAMKILPPAIGLSPAFSSRFTREAKALAKLNHPGIVTIHESGQEGGLYYILMEYVDGVNLRQLLANGRISPREAMAIVPQICDALQFAHDQGIVHRDIKPENLLLDRLGRVKVADFGIAKLMGNDDPAATTTHTLEATLTDGGKAMGTPQYMAPEQTDSPAEVDHRADIFALGVVFYQMLTGELPEKDIQPPSRKVSIDVRLDEVVMKALEKNPAMRYSNATAFKTGIAEFEQVPPNKTPWLSNYRSEREIFGLPLLHLVVAPDPKTGRKVIAKGIVAIGGQALGVFAFGGVASGFMAFGGIAIGIFSFGGISLGLGAMGGVALAAIIAIGGTAIGTIALGSTSVGYYSFGSSAFGTHALGGNAKSQKAIEFFLPWANDVLSNLGTVLMVVMAFLFLVIFGLPLWVHRSTKTGIPLPVTKPLGLLAILALSFACITLVTFFPSLYFGKDFTPPPYVENKTNPEKSQETHEPALDFKKELLELQPTLEGMAWQDETNARSRKPTGTTWTANGTPPAETSSWPASPGSPFEQLAASDHTEEARTLCAWFSHPLIDEASLQKVTFINPDTNLRAAYSYQSTRNLSADTKRGRKGWMIQTARLDDKQYLRKDLIISLRYAIDSWEDVREIPLSFKDGISLTDGIVVSPATEDPKRNAQIEITADQDFAGFRNQIRLRAVTKSGKIFDSSESSGTANGVVFKRLLSFPFPLSDVKNFLYSKRPIKESRFSTVLIQSEEEQVLHTYVENMVSLKLAKHYPNESSPHHASAETMLTKFLQEHPELPNLQSRDLLEHKALRAKKDLEEAPGTMMAEMLKTRDPVKFEKAQRRRFILEAMVKSPIDKVFSETMRPDNLLEVRRVTTQEDPDSEAMPLSWIDQEGKTRSETIHVRRDAIIWGELVEKGIIDSDDSGTSINIELNDTGANRMRLATLTNDKQLRLAIIVDGKAISAPVIMNAPLGRRFQISGFQTRAEAVDLVRSFPGYKREMQVLAGINWLQLIDEGNILGAYETAAPSFKSKLAKEEWIQSIEALRLPLGSFSGVRKILSVVELSSLHGFPDGDYRLVKFESHFENQQQSIETVTLVRKAGEWQVLEYFIQ